MLRLEFVDSVLCPNLEVMSQHYCTKQWNHCANQYSSCSCTGTARFGEGSNWVEKAVTGSINCSNVASDFGSDPSVGNGKTCECAGSCDWDNSYSVANALSSSDGGCNSITLNTSAWKKV